MQTQNGVCIHDDLLTHNLKERTRHIHLVTSIFVQNLFVEYSDPQLIHSHLFVALVPMTFNVSYNGATKPQSSILKCGQVKQEQIVSTLFR
jgi:hypothetical protein